MQTRPVSYVVEVSGDAEDAPKGAQSIALYGELSGDSKTSFSDLNGSVSGLKGSDLQAILRNIASRLADLEK